MFYTTRCQLAVTILLFFTVVSTCYVMLLLLQGSVVICHYICVKRIIYVYKDLVYVTFIGHNFKFRPCAPYQL
jgi:hypothetical protein